ncbi:ATP-binding protein [Lebetimonas sp. JH369]|uniref:AAA family ATPase n=1 Tax=Lebetimonas sp. JH369 TaxID=990069 RepID=UPI0004668DAB|nr:ATP-binding protein [Lebetimonas sp. JH369]
MEIIYFWIEEYKNIKNQGFNLSSKYNCNYNFEKEELTIKEKTNYINIFPENINVKAIIGKNGSGKSNLVKVIFELIYLYFFKEEQSVWCENDKAKEDDIINKKTTLFIDNYINHKFFLIIKDKNEFFKIDSEYIKKLFQKKGFKFINIKKSGHSLDEFKLKNISNYENKITSFSIYYNFSTDSWFDEQSPWVNEIYHRKDNYNIPLLIEPYKKDNKLDLNLIKTLTNQRILLFYALLNNKLNKYKITSFFNPDRIKIKYAKNLINTQILNDLKYENEDLWTDKDTAQYASKNESIIEKLNTNYYKIIHKYIIFFEKLAFKEDIYYAINLDHLNIINTIYNYYENYNYKNLNLLYLLFKLIEIREYKKQRKNLGNEIIDKIENFENKIKNIKIEKEFKNLLAEFKDYINDTNFNFNDKDYNLIKIEIAFEFHKNKYYDKLKKIFNNEKNEIFLNKLDNTENIIYYFPGWLEAEFFEGEKSLNSLSSGEKIKFEFLIGLLYQLNNLNTKEYDSVNIFLDEIELGLHPEWQRKYLKDIIFTFEQFKKYTNFNKKINLFFLTHSPFLLSDIPKENIIFLKDGKNISDEVNINTFGSNIHTLLSHAFFMEDGLIGDFAKEKIDDVIKYLNNEKSKIDSDEKAQQIINIIGEPIIKKQLQNMLDSKRLSKVNEIDEIKKEMELLKHRLEILRKNS